MKKKTHHRKTKPTHLEPKKDSFSMYFTLFRQGTGIVAVFILVALLYPLLITKKVPCADSISCKQQPKFEIEKNAIGTYNNRAIKVPNISLNQGENANPILGAKTSSGEKHIYINLSTQTLSAYEGGAVFMQTLISSGLRGKTPRGNFTIWSKFRSTRMTGGSGADYYDLPNVPYVMYFSNNEVPGSLGFSLHGTYWHTNFGHEMSQGAIDMQTYDIQKLYEWADSSTNGKKGTPITIYAD